jgi:hypothetical protein
MENMNLSETNISEIATYDTVEISPAMTSVNPISEESNSSRLTREPEIKSPKIMKTKGESPIVTTQKANSEKVSPPSDMNIREDIASISHDIYNIVADSMIPSPVQDDPSSATAMMTSVAGIEGALSSEEIPSYDSLMYVYEKS